MKKKNILVVVGLVLITLGVVVYNTQKRNRDIEYIEESLTLSKSEATKLVEDTINNVINVYENIDKVFEIDGSYESEKEIKVTNYDEIVKTIFTENGIKELENISFGKNKFVTKKDNDILLLKEIPSDNQYTGSSISLDGLNIGENEITCNVTLTTYKLVKDKLTYYVFEKNIKLVKNEENWLVDTFKYSN